MYLEDCLPASHLTDDYGFHMPGHKRGTLNPFLSGNFSLAGVDITEIPGFDDLHEPTGILKEEMDRAAAFYGTAATIFSVNGSTASNLAAVSAAVPDGGCLIAAGNCHRSIPHAAEIRRLKMITLTPPMLRPGIPGPIVPSSVGETLDRARREGSPASAVVITSPTYEGVFSDIRAIAGEVHRREAVLIVDEAHGAHFSRHPAFPESAVGQGADLVIHSVHKTLPSLTQTALLHVQGMRVDRERLKRFLGMYQTSSPSYVLMAGIDACVRMLLEHGPELFDTFAKRLEGLRKQLFCMQALELVRGTEPELGAYDYDRSKILVATHRSGIAGPELSGMLRSRYQLEMEMDSEHYVTAITTVADTKEGLQRLAEALAAIDSELERQPGKQARPFAAWENEAVLRIGEAAEAGKKSMLLAKSEGSISAEFVYLYPPGIPLLVPGERISGELLEKLLQYRANGFALEGMADYRGEEIQIVKA